MVTRLFNLAWKCSAVLGKRLRLRRFTLYSCFECEICEVFFICEPRVFRGVSYGNSLYDWVWTGCRNPQGHTNSKMFLLMTQMMGLETVFDHNGVFGGLLVPIAQVSRAYTLHCHLNMHVFGGIASSLHSVDCRYSTSQWLWFQFYLVYCFWIKQLIRLWLEQSMKVSFNLMRTSQP